MPLPSDDDLIHNARITKAKIILDGGRYLSVWLDLDYGTTYQAFGGYILGGTHDCKAGKHTLQPNYAAEFIVRCMEIGEVEEFDRLVGKTVRVRRSNKNGIASDIVAIGHIIKDDCWFTPQVVLSEMESHVS